MGVPKIVLTVEDFDNYPFEEDKRYELDEGELIATTRPAYLAQSCVRKAAFCDRDVFPQESDR